MDYYFFDEYGELIEECYFSSEEKASAYCDQIGADFFCSDEDQGLTKSQPYGIIIIES